jgi:hypothetical protein
MKVVSVSIADCGLRIADCGGVDWSEAGARARGLYPSAIRNPQSAIRNRDTHHSPLTTFLVDACQHTAT